MQMFFNGQCPKHDFPISCNRDPISDVIASIFERKNNILQEFQQAEESKQAPMDIPQSRHGRFSPIATLLRM
jgi:hypothetical protein